MPQAEPQSKKRANVAAQKRRVFLARLAECGRVNRSASLAQVDRSLLYKERAANPQFAQEWQDALAMAMGAAEDEVYRRGVRGIDKAVFYKGEQVATVREYSDLLLMFLLKANNPAKYRDNYQGAEDGAGADLDAWERDTI